MGRRSRRGRKPLPEAERKDRLVQARVDEELDEALRQAAKDKQVTVSQLIRNILQSTFHLVDDVVAGTASLTEAVVRDARRLADSAKGKPPPPSERAAAAVDAWQEVVLARDATCSRCGASLPRGARARLGLAADPAAPRLFRCLRCGV